MRIVIQRVTQSSVSIDGRMHSSIGAGMTVLVGVENGDSTDDVRWLAEKTASLRIFNDENGVMNLPITATGGEILAVSQFTLMASTRKGNRPSYIRAARPEPGKELYDLYCDILADITGQKVAKGIFGADMQVSIVNDGPVTIIIDSRLRE